MGQAKVSYGVVLGVERILLEYSDQDHPLSVTEIQTHLKNIYGIDVSKDTLTKRILPEMSEFSWSKPLLKGAGPGLYAGWDMYPLPATKTQGANGERERNSPRKKTRVWAQDRLFSNFEVNYISDAVATAVFLGEGKSKDLIQRIQTLQSLNCREDRTLRRFTGDGSAKPDFRDIAYTMEMLGEAIDRRQIISFDYLRYGIQKRPGTLSDQDLTLDKKSRQGGDHYDNLSPYRLQFMDEHYFLLANARNKSETRDAFKVFRLDLMANIELSTNSELYKPLVNEDAPADYFRGAVSGIGGRRKNIKLRCSESAYHYVAERFSEFEGFKTTRPADDPDDWLLVEFRAVPKGVGYWVQKFLKDIEVLAPKKTRDEILANLQDNAYGAFSQRQPMPHEEKPL